jgi:hypothetical protein
MLLMPVDPDLLENQRHQSNRSPGHACMASEQPNTIKEHEIAQCSMIDVIAKDVHL